MRLSDAGYAELVKHYAADPTDCVRLLKESFDARQRTADEFDFGRLFEECYGHEQFRACKQNRREASDVIGRNLVEGPGGVGTSNFLNITGQIVYSAVLEKYQLPDFRFTALIPTVSTQFLDGEKMAGVTQIGDEAQVRDEFAPYVEAGVTEDWIFTPTLKDRGEIVSLTWEAVFADRTGQLLERAGAVGESLGINKEKRAIDCVIDENVTAHRYNWRGTVIASYGDNSGTHTWDNLEASNAFVDWTNIDKLDQLFYNMTDPYTGEPFVQMAKHLIVPTRLMKAGMRALTQTDIRVSTPGFPTSGNPTQTTTANPYANKVELISTPWIEARQGTKTSWYYGDVTRYASYMQAEPLNVMQAAPNNTKEFENRIVSRFRANERGAYVVRQPRAMTKATA